MKKYFFLLLLYTFPAFSAQLTFLDEAGQLGTMAGC